MSRRSIPAGPVRACSPREGHGYSARAVGKPRIAGSRSVNATAEMTALPPNATLGGVSICSMTAKEKLRARVEDLTEQEAEAALDFIASRGQSFGDWLDARPEDDEPLTPEERAALAESDADIAAGRTVSYEQVKQDLESSAE
jgi:hypothetical protein